MTGRTRFTAIAALLVPLAAACSPNDRPIVGSNDAGATGATTTVSNGATAPATSESATTNGTRGTYVAGTVAPSYADAERAFHRGRYEEATSMFEAYTESDPDNAWGHYMLGLSAWKTGDHARALEAFDAALRLDPTHRKSLLNSARVLMETGRAQDALNRIEQALAIEPLSSEGLRLAGRAHYELGQVDQAIDAYQRALAIDDRDTWAMNNLGYIYIQQGRSDSALPPLARAVELRRNVPVFQNNLGTALERSGHFVSAREAYQAALAADSTYTKAAVGLERVTSNGAVSDSSTIDLAALSQEFQSQVEQWRTRAVAADSTPPSDSVPSTSGHSVPGAGGDSVSSPAMARDSTQ